MSVSRYIAGDWGTTHLRLYLCDSRGEVLARVEGPGASQMSGNYATLFTSLIAPWTDNGQNKLPAILCGMVGSSIGWKLVNAVQCPASLGALAQSVYSIPEHDVFIVPGLACRNLLNAPDVMRGEETQLLGMLQLKPALQKGSHVFCLPGTHTKWAMVVDNSIEHFTTIPTGELFSILYKHSVLVRDARNSDAPIETDQSAFQKGLQEAASNPAVGLLGKLFQCRSRRVTGELTAHESPSFMSGLLIASDVMDAFALMKDVMSSGVTIIGNTELGGLYQQALSTINVSATIVSGDDAVRRGLVYVHDLLHQ